MLNRPGFTRQVKLLKIGEASITVTASVENYVPARGGSNDDARPVEGGSIEIESVQYCGKDITRCLREIVFSDLEGQFQDGED